MYLAIDIGATKTLIALFSRRGRVVRRIKFPTAQGSKTFINTLVDKLGSFRKYRVKNIVVAIPGIVQKNCSVRFGNREWGDIDICTPIISLFDCPIYFENDANLATLYEAHGLSGRTIFLTFSTGIGGGIAENNHIVDSADFEPGHWIYQYDNKTAEWEDIAAASAIGKKYHIDAATSLRGKKTMQDVAARMYLGLPDIVAKYHPDTIIMGGPMGKIFRLYCRYIPKISGVKYRRPKRPLESVIYGCYIYARQQEQK